MVRLNDMLRLDDPGPIPPAAVVPQMRYRAGVVARRAAPTLSSTPTTGRFPTSATWREYLDAKRELGVPSLYYATHLDLTGEALDEDDYAALRARLGSDGVTAHEPSAGSERPVDARRHRARGGDVRVDRVARAERARLRLDPRARPAGRRRRAPRLRPERVGADAQAAHEPRRRRRRLRARQPVLRRLAAGIEQVLREARLPDGDRSATTATRRGARRRPHVPRDARARGDHDAGRRRGGARSCTRTASPSSRSTGGSRAPCDAVVIDNERGGREATMHLVGLGHTRIALLGVDTRRGRPTRAGSRAIARRLTNAGIAARRAARRAHPAPRAGHRRADRVAARRGRPDRDLRREQRARRAGVAGAAPARAVDPRGHLARRVRRRPLDGDGRSGDHGRRPADARARPLRRPGSCCGGSNGGGGRARRSRSCSRGSSSGARPGRALR